MILHLSTFHLEGGAGIAATRLHRALLKAGVQSAMLVPDTRHPENGVTALADTTWKKQLVFARFAGERLHFLPHEKDRSVRFAFSPARIGADISSHPLVQAADILHLHWFNFGFLSMRSLEKLFRLGKPVVWTMHDMWAATGGCHYNRGCDHFLTHCRHCPYLSTAGPYDISFTQFEKKQSLYGIPRIALVSPSNWLDHTVKSAALTAPLHSLSIPNCIDTQVFKPGDQASARQRLQLPDGKKLILFAGANTQDPRKGFSFFREAIEPLHMQYPDLEVIMFGKTKNAALADLAAKVHYLGKITDTAQMVDAYNAADVIAVPSLEDNLPNTIMEAMACGTPAIGFRTGGIPEMIDHQLNGYVAEAGSSPGLAEGISWVLAHNEQGRLSHHAREKVLSHYAEEVVTRRYHQLYESMLP
ncbi:glycosyltransferase family 4 protein [Dyadobacter sandarakinus]|uniref:Glycosyltransferase n=1 Tax=Dyadobacter sandarakinus TaxID=2747268 RepID=A0ABX7I8Z2_9BACT|nr:glycosyltransferase family 4 protein [Dyadobacter sandarakinus]QRR01932.1 glycosyltransferase [Dyadobacter sandarakinus]